MTDNDRLIIISRFYTDDGETRVNKLKFVPNNKFVQVYINNGKTKDNMEKYASIRLRFDQLNELKNYLNSLEL